ncbi:MAG: HAMP domain-containing histidine kinase [Elusimicrobia bacterium]|nr:HAMP domain-containing histidine kinase [Elusimicrobiota bacterium]
MTDGPSTAGGEGAGREPLDPATDALVGEVRSLIERLRLPTKLLKPAPPVLPVTPAAPAAPALPVNLEEAVFTTPVAPEAPAAPAAPTAPEAEPGFAEAPAPGLDPLLEPSWLRVAGELDGTLARSLAHVRRAGGGRLPEGSKALLRLAATELARARDRLRLVMLLLDDGRVLEDTPLQAVVDAVLAAWEPTLRSRGVALRRRGGVGLRVRVDADGLRTALFELVRNAFEAMPRGGTLSVAVRRGEDGRAVIEVADSGPGFSPEALASAFTPFASPKPGRLGVGLALASRVARRAGGDADAANPPGGGARVTLAIPASGPEQPTLS